MLISTNKHFNYIPLREETMLFIGITSSTIIAITFYNSILKLLHIVPPFRIKHSKKNQKFRLDEILEYFFTKENLRFTIYTAFFIYLIFYSFKLFEGEYDVVINKIDKATLQSFLCFIAYDRLLLNSKSVSALPSVILNKVFNSITQKEKEKENIKENGYTNDD